MSLEKYKKLYSTLNGYRKECKEKAIQYVIHQRRLYSLQKAKEQLIEEMLNRQQRRNSWMGRFERNDQDAAVDYSQKLAAMDVEIELITNASYKNYRDIHRLLSQMSSIIQQLIQKHEFLVQVVNEHVNDRLTYHIHDYQKDISRHFPSYLSALYGCEAILLYLKDYIVKHLTEVRTDSSS